MVSACSRSPCRSLSAAPVPADFIDDVRPLYDVVTCQGTPLAQLDAKTLAAFCTRQNKRYGHFRAGWAVRERKNNPTKSGGGRVAGLVGRHGVGAAEHRRGPHPDFGRAGARKELPVEWVVWTVPVIYAGFVLRRFSPTAAWIGAITSLALLGWQAFSMFASGAELRLVDVGLLSIAPLLALDGARAAGSPVRHGQGAGGDEVRPRALSRRNVLVEQAGCAAPSRQ